VSSSPETLEILAGANPVPADGLDRRINAHERDLVLRDVLARVNDPRRRRRRKRALIFAVAVLVAVPSFALAAELTQRFHAEPAPESVVREFGQYTRQLGFDPRAADAQLVAADADVRLYVTPNAQGTWCYLVSTRNDGGTCVHADIAQAPVVAGIAGSGNPSDEGRARRFVVVGRVLDRRATGVSMSVFNGDEVTRRVGAGGYFLIVLFADADDESWCTSGWTANVAFTDRASRPVSSYRLALVRPVPSGCVAPGLATPDE
jgi:hypothetical protein